MKLRSLLTAPGVRAAALVGRDGLALEAYGEEGDHLAAELAALRAGMERASRRLNGGPLTRLAFTSERFEIVAVAVGEFTAAVAVTRGQDTRPAQMELARVAVELQGRLPGRKE
ncbi:roadblock/LC7 domain-containing protein [Deinococcus yavapaiensis]|uniref:Roadblock/LC7 domain-containing protein n=1 Tax=Deinococcus yavapaiensis KR-236 TaxID=694435 RepID=A0A318S861_9DEIO|nr:roadblock/LC7 domain-containing protein [Deinococcus yavapaiensis]PYE55246.1 Roadblock/LC7 domain-containing protein [Deinococcus yavapaiensis KR-236]